MTQTTLNATGPTREELRDWLVIEVAKQLEVDPGNIRTDIPIDEYGLDSVAAVNISGSLADWIHQDLPGTLLYEYPTIDELSAHLSQSAS